MDKLTANLPTVVIKQVDLKTTEDHILEEYLDFIEMAHYYYYPNIINPSRSFRTQNIRNHPTNQYKRSYLAYINDKIVGYGSFGFRIVKIENNPDYAWFDIEIHPEYLTNGIGQEILREIMADAVKIGRTRLNIWTAPGPIQEQTNKILHDIGFKHVITEKDNRLYKDKINWNFINSSEKVLEDKLKGITFEIISTREWIDKVLTEPGYDEKMADFRTEGFNLFPRGNTVSKDRTFTSEDIINEAEADKNNPWENIVIFAYHKDKIIGNSGTYFSKDPVQSIGIGGTVVRTAYQRRGIATFMKIKIIKYFIDNYPSFEYIYTENSKDNEGILAINKNLGFKETGEHFNFEGNIDEILEIIGV